MRDEEGFYYPHSLDFRGRAYPMHPHLNHLSSDLCRGILEFAEGRPLGRSGLRWLKIHLANLYAGGVEKLSYDGRLAFVENHLDDIFDSAERPVDGERWWLNAEDPFQCLAACMNLSDALKSSSPHSVISHIPIHQVTIHQRPWNFNKKDVWCNLHVADMDCIANFNEEVKWKLVVERIFPYSRTSKI